MAKQQKKLGEILIEWGAVKAAEVDKALAHAKAKNMRIGEALVDMKLASETQVYKALASQHSMEYVDLDPYDVISFPTGVARRFMNVTYDEPNREHLLMFIIGGNQPQAEFTPDAMRRCEEFARGRATPRPSRAAAQPPRSPARGRRSAAARGVRRRTRARRAGR